MPNYREIKPEELALNPFQAIGRDWMLVTAEKEGKVNMLTASWGGMGILWGKPVAFIFIRPQRFTREFLDAAESFSLTFYDESYRKQLSYAGSHSGRDGDKIAHCGFTTAFDGVTPYFTEAHTVLLCKKLYRQLLDPAGFLDTALDLSMYPERDHHIVYVGEIEKVMLASDK
jgi:flavin reductase (DIM6/NTAB) family NADH-FMN oxidoreductase RutF